MTIARETLDQEAEKRINHWRKEKLELIKEERRIKELITLGCHSEPDVLSYAFIMLCEPRYERVLSKSCSVPGVSSAVRTCEIFLEDFILAWKTSGLFLEREDEVKRLAFEAVKAFHQYRKKKDEVRLYALAEVLFETTKYFRPERNDIPNIEGLIQSAEKLGGKERVWETRLGIALMGLGVALAIGCLVTACIFNPAVIPIACWIAQKLALLVGAALVLHGGEKGIYGAVNKSRFLKQELSAARSNRPVEEEKPHFDPGHDSLTCQMT